MDNTVWLVLANNKEDGISDPDWEPRGVWSTLERAKASVPAKDWREGCYAGEADYTARGFEIWEMNLDEAIDPDAAFQESMLAV